MTLSITLVGDVQQLETTVQPSLDKTATNDSILIIENDLYLSSLLQPAFVEQGYAVSQSYYKGQLTAELKNAIIDKPSQLVVLNLGFTEPSQLTIIRDIRQIFNGPLIVISTQGSELEEVQAFNFGADEYLLKPVSENILSVRIAALFRRYNQKIKQTELASLSLGDLCLEPKAQRCFVNENIVKLTGFEFNLLRLLLEREGQILSRDKLYGTLLGRVYNGVERTIDVRMSQLREKLLRAGMTKIQIETIWGQGYMLSA